MFFGLKQHYERLPIEERDKAPSSPRRIPEHVQNHLLLHALAFVLGLGVGAGLVLVLLFTVKIGALEVQSLPSVIPPEIFSPRIPMSWVPDTRYMGYSNFSNEMWRVLTEPTDMVWLDDSLTHELESGFEAKLNGPSKSRPPPQFYRISNLHQLECLNIVRVRHFELLYNISPPSNISKTTTQNIAYRVDDCIEYLRMTILCGGNWDIEADSPPGTPRQLRVDTTGYPMGWGGTRHCVNWDALTTWQRRQLDLYKATWPELK